MRRGERIFREMLHRYYTGGERFFSQKELARSCGLSLGTVNPLVKRLELMGMVECRPLGLRLLDPERMLIYWAARRDLFGDIIYATYAPESPQEIESVLSPLGVLTANSGFKRLFEGISVNYSEVYLYARKGEVQSRYGPREGKPNLFVLRPDEHLQKLSQGGVAPLVQIYVDLWQLGQLGGSVREELEKKLRAAPLRAIEGVMSPQQ
ncbi:MAG: winged helix-turn-helix domain-containing protein [Candidatus Hadarchaeales archaeon]